MFYGVQFENAGVYIIRLVLMTRYLKFVHLMRTFCRKFKEKGVFFHKKLMIFPFSQSESNNLCTFLRSSYRA